MNENSMTKKQGAHSERYFALCGKKDDIMETINYASYRVSNNSILARNAMSIIMRTERDLILSVPALGQRFIFESSSLNGSNPKCALRRVEIIPTTDGETELIMLGKNPVHDNNVVLVAVSARRIMGTPKPHRFMTAWMEKPSSHFIFLKSGADPLHRIEKILLTRFLAEQGIDFPLLDNGLDWGWLPDIMDGEQSPYWDNLPIIWDADASTEQTQEHESEPESGPDNDDIPIKDLGFSVRSRNCLEMGNIKTLSQLADVSIDELMQIKHFSKKCLTEVREKLAQYGLKLKDDME